MIEVVKVVQDASKANFENLLVWKRAVELAALIYKTTQNFPKEEMYGLTSQIRRASISISSNIAEGTSRQSGKEFLQFLYVSQGSASEIKSQLHVALKISYISQKEFEDIYEKCNEVSFLLSKLIISIKNKNNIQQP